MAHLPYPRPTGDFRVTYESDMVLFRTLFAHRWALALAAVALVLPLVANDALLSQMIMIGIFAIAALGLNVLVGYTGQISLGHAAFFGFGAFSSAWLHTQTSIPVLLTIPLAGLMTTAVGMVFGIPAARLKGLYLAIATLASQFILEDFFARADWFTGGPYGALADSPMLFGFALDSDSRYFYLVLFWLVLSYFAVANLVRTRDGRAFIAVRDHYLSAEIMGINLTKYRVLSFGISSFFAGIGGALYGHYLGFVTGEAFNILLSIQFLAMIIIGGLGSITGPILGTVFVLLLPQAMEFLASGLALLVPGIGQGVAYIKEMSIGAAIMLFLIFEPDGLIHRWRLMRTSWKLFPFSH